MKVSENTFIAIEKSLWHIQATEPLLRDRLEDLEKKRRKRVENQSQKKYKACRQPRDLFVQDR